MLVESYTLAMLGRSSLWQQFSLSRAQLLVSYLRSVFWSLSVACGTCLGQEDVNHRKQHEYQSFDIIYYEGGPDTFLECENSI